MANRHISRSVALQTLFEWDFRNYSTNKIDAIVERNSEDFAPGVADIPFTKKLVHEAIVRQGKLDVIIQKAAPDWPIEKISIVDRNVLRIGLYELLFMDRKEVPAKVAINEAIELAKMYGSENSSRFVNGVLGAVYKEIGEPGKEEKSKHKHDVPYQKMPLEQLGGAVVYGKKEDGKYYLAFVHDIFGHWTLSKGKLKPSENPEHGTIRAIKEEIGIDMTIKKKLGENEYIANDPEVGKKRKHVSYFLAENSPFTELILEESGGLDNAQWFCADDVESLNLYEDIRPLVLKALEELRSGVYK